jgi:hypothetical protein
MNGNVVIDSFAGGNVLQKPHALGMTVLYRHGTRTLKMFAAKVARVQ